MICYRRSRRTYNRYMDVDFQISLSRGRLVWSYLCNDNIIGQVTKNLLGGHWEVIVTKLLYRLKVNITTISIAIYLRGYVDVITRIHENHIITGYMNWTF